MIIILQTRADSCWYCDVFEMFVWYCRNLCVS